MATANGGGSGGDGDAGTSVDSGRGMMTRAMAAAATRDRREKPPCLHRGARFYDGVSPTPVEHHATAVTSGRFYDGDGPSMLGNYGSSRPGTPHTTAIER